MLFLENTYQSTFGSRKPASRNRKQGTKKSVEINVEAYNNNLEWIHFEPLRIFQVFLKLFLFPDNLS